MERKITGSFDINIDPSGMEARLIFTPLEEGTEWNVPAVTAFMEKKRVKEGYTTASVDSLFPVFMKAKPGDFSVTEIAAAGTPPGPPVPAEIAWSEIAVPDHLKEDAESFFNKAPAPEFYLTRIEKIQKTRIVKEKKSAFLPPKEKKVTVTEEREVKEPVAVDPSVISSGWIQSGAVVAEITPGTPGEDGKDVYGRPVPSEKSKDELVLSEGLEEKDNKIISSVSGFLRRGTNWVHVSPFLPHRWTIELSKDKNTVLFSFKSGQEGAFPPRVENIIQEALALGVAEETLMTSFELGNLLQDALDYNKVLQAVPISTSDDGFFEILVSEDKLKAILNMKKHRGSGKPLVLKEFGKALKEKQFKTVDYKKIQEDVLAFYRGNEVELEEYILAEGEPPEQPGERKVEYTLKYLDNSLVQEIKKTAASIREGNGLEGGLDGIESLQQFPVDTADKMAMVTAGMVIAEINQEPGLPGKDVFGGKIEFNEITDSGFRFLGGIERKGQSICTTMEGLLEQWEKDGITALRIRPHKNSLVEIKVAPNKMSASISLTPPVGTGTPLLMDSVRTLIAEKGIVFGVKNDILERAVEHACAGEVIRDLVFANGEPPVNGEDAKLEFLVELSKDKGVTIKADGRADYRNQDHITMVKKGQPIVRLLKSKIQVQNGTDVTGGAIPGKDVPQDSLEIGDNVETKDGEKEVLYSASTGGELIYEKNKISVLNVHIVNGNVGKTSGNVKFSGTVKISGLVQSGYVVMSQEDIFVKDNVEACLLSAGGEIVVEKGIVGGGKAILRARKTVKATFAEQCTLLAIEGVYLKRSCMQCSVKTNGKLNVVGDKGTILGGDMRVREGLETHNLGSEKAVKTSVSFGQDYLIYDQIELEDKEIDKVKIRIAKVDLFLQKAEKEKSEEKLGKLRGEKLKLMKLIEKRSMRVLMLRERFEEHHQSEIVVRGNIYPGVILESHGRTLEINEPASNVTYFFDLETGHIKSKKNKEN